MGNLNKHYQITEILTLSIKNLPQQKQLPDKINYDLFKTNEIKCNNKNMNNNSIIDECSCLKRLSYALKVYKRNKNINNKVWNEFCVNVYGNRVLDDYHHLLSKHQNDIENIKNELIEKYEFSQCLVN
eukprot:395425_1